MRKGKAEIKRVIFIIADTLRTKNIGVYGREPTPTPNIDRFAKSGVVFTNAYCSITKTDPSITSIMSGKYPATVGLVNHGSRITAQEEQNLLNINLIPEILKEHGFRTMAIDWLGRWHKRGFDYYSGKIQGIYSKRITIFDFTSLMKSLLFFLRQMGIVTVKIFRRDYFARLYYAFSKNTRVPYDTADVVVDIAINVLKKNKKEPLFLYLHLWDAHDPHSRPKGLKSYLFDNVEDTYEAEISFMDEQIGRLLDFLKKTGEDKSTLIIFTADHGENFHEFGIPLGHNQIFDLVVKVPLIIKGGGLKPKLVDNLIQHVDLLPTILEMLDIKPPIDLDGKSVLPVIMKNKDIRELAFFEDILYRRFIFFGRTRKQGIRTDNYKYIRTYKGTHKEVGEIMPGANMKVASEELYNLQRDPGEKKNIIDKNRKLAGGLSGRMDKFINELNFKRLKANPEFYEKVNKSLEVIKRTFKKYPEGKVAIAWTGGKDSTVLLHLVRLAFDGKVPFKVIFNDSTMEFDEIYEFIDKVKKLWDLDLITIKHSRKELREFHAMKNRERQKELSRLIKITAINTAVKKYKFEALISGIRWDEHESRSRETYFSKRADHDRVHPILQFTEKDIWEYTDFFGVPFVSLYKKGYRSLGEKPFTTPAVEGEGERSGREKEKELLMVNLRKLGYW